RMSIDPTGYISLGQSGMTMSGDASSITPLLIIPGTFTDTVAGVNGVIDSFTSCFIEFCTLNGSNTGVKTTQAYTVYIDGGPSPNLNMTITHSHSLGTNGDIYLEPDVANDPSTGFITTADNGTFIDNATAANTTSSMWAAIRFGTCSLGANNSGVITTNAYNLYVDAAPTALYPMTITNGYSLGVAGNAYFASTTAS